MSKKDDDEKVLKKMFGGEVPEDKPARTEHLASTATILVLSWANDGESLRYRVLDKDGNWSKDVYRIHRDEFSKHNSQIRIGGREKLPSDFKHEK